MGIQDLKVIAIIRAMLKAKILFNDIVISPETGTPQGGILSPLLSNIVLNELDWWVSKQWETMPTRVNREYNLNFHPKLTLTRSYTKKNLENNPKNVIFLKKRLDKRTKIWHNIE
jgi:retron-type reverse transcriptase